MRSPAENNDNLTRDNTICMYTKPCKNKIVSLYKKNLILFAEYISCLFSDPIVAPSPIKIAPKPLPTQIQTNRPV